jgi:hypothetical protein
LIHSQSHHSKKIPTLNVFFDFPPSSYIKMRFSIISALSLVGAGMVAATPMEGSLSSNVMRRGDSTEAKVHDAAAALAGSKQENESETSECVGSLLCCGTLTTPLDHIVDPILEDLGIDAANIVGSIGLLCKYWMNHQRLPEL